MPLFKGGDLHVQGQILLAALGHEDQFQAGVAADLLAEPAQVDLDGLGARQGGAVALATRSA
jgi:hypothetical protein